MESVKNVENKCHDCGKQILINDQKIENGSYLVYEHNGEKINILKCQDCFAKNKTLTNFQKCEVYSRVVGYIRPVEQWHKGKQQEYSERLEFKTPPGPCC